jgi:outer membrane protein assembly factor BamB
MGPAASVVAASGTGLAERLGNACTKRMLPHSLIVVLTVAVSLCGASAAAAKTVGSWGSYGATPANTRDDTGETLLSAATLGELTGGWTFSEPSGNFTNWTAPAVSGGLVYTGTPRTGVMYALSVATGKIVWEFQTGGIESPPAVSGKLVFIGSTDGNCYAVNATTGALVWKFSTGGAVLSPVVAGHDVYLASRDGNIYAVAAQTGAEIWARPVATHSHEASDVAYESGHLYYSAWVEPAEWDVQAEVFALSSKSGSEQWHRAFFGSWCCGSALSAPAVSGGRVFAYAMWGGAGGTFAAFSAKTGGELWEDPGSWFPGGNGASGIAVAGGVVVANYGFSTPGPCESKVPVGNCGYPGGEGVIAMNPETGAPVWVDHAPTWSSLPTAAGGLIYARFDTEAGLSLGAAEPATGKIAWQEPSLENAAGYVAEGNLLVPDGSSMLDYQLPILNTAKPAIQGKTVVGSQLKASAGAWSGALTKPSYSYSWSSCPSEEERECSTIEGATASKLKLSSALLGRYVTVTVTASDENQSGTATSTPVGPVVDH